MPKKTVEVATIEELFSSSTDGSIPVLLDIEHQDIIWQDADLEQDNGHLRLINAPYSVRYEGKKYLPSYFEFSMPSEDGKTISSTSVTISAIDQRIISVIRSVNDKPTVTFHAFFTKKDNLITFSKLFKYKFQMDSVSWNGISAKWNLIFDPTMQLQVPRDVGTSLRCPGVAERS